MRNFCEKHLGLYKQNIEETYQGMGKRSQTLAKELQQKLAKGGKRVQDMKQRLEDKELTLGKKNAELEKKVIELTKREFWISS